MGHGVAAISPVAEDMEDVVIKEDHVVSKVRLRISMRHPPRPPLSFRFLRRLSSTTREAVVNVTSTGLVSPTPAAIAVVFTSGVCALRDPAFVELAEGSVTGTPSVAALDNNYNSISKLDAARAAGKRSLMSAVLGITLPGDNCAILTL